MSRQVPIAVIAAALEPAGAAVRGQLFYSCAMTQLEQAVSWLWTDTILPLERLICRHHFGRTDAAGNGYCETRRTNSCSGCSITNVNNIIYNAAAIQGDSDTPADVSGVALDNAVVQEKTKVGMDCSRLHFNTCDGSAVAGASLATGLGPMTADPSYHLALTLNVTGTHSHVNTVAVSQMRGTRTALADDSMRDLASPVKSGSCSAPGDGPSTFLSDLKVSKNTHHNRCIKQWQRNIH